MPGIFALFGLLAAVFAGAASGGSDAPAVRVAEAGPDDDHTDHDMGGGSEAAEFQVITEFGMFHGSSSHTMGHSLEGGRTPITTEAMDAYNGLRAFLGLEPVGLAEIGQWAFDNDLTNNDMAYGDDLMGVGLFYGMQGAKAGWIRDDAFDPQILADIQRTARLGEQDDVMAMVDSHGHAGFADYLRSEGLVETFVNTMKMEPHYGGWMHGRTHGDLAFDDETGTMVATAHDLNHLTVLSHDQTQPFMNDTFDWPQWPALDAPEADVIDYFQSMVTLGDPQGDGITSEMTASFLSSPAPGPGEMIMHILTVEPVEETYVGWFAEEEDEPIALL